VTDDVDKVTPLAEHFAFQCVLPSFIVADEVICERNFLADAEKQLELSTLAKVIDIVRVNLRRVSPNSEGNQT
jgi:hypothetical protein